MIYQLYGLTLQTDFRFRSPLPVAEESSEADIIFSVSPATVNPLGNRGRRLYRSVAAQDDTPIFFIEEYVDRVVFTFTGLVRYHVIGGKRVIAERLGDIADSLIEIHFLGLISSYLLESRGMLALHASAAATQHGAIAFLAGNKGGKTSLAAAFVQAGDMLLTDDILATLVEPDRVVGAPGFPQMRMWPEHAEKLIGESEAFERVLPNIDKRFVPLSSVGRGDFCSEPQQMRAFFVPDRQSSSDAIRIEPIEGAAVFKILLVNGFTAGIAEACGFREMRFRAIALLAQRVPVYRLVYPEGIQHLPEVRRAILSTIAQ